MRTRHRIPSIFNLSMVDVLCCALGCVILLWLLNLREARQKSAQAGESDERLVALRGDLDAARAQLADLTGKYAAAQSQFDEAERRTNAVRAHLEAAQAEGRATADSLKKVRSERDAARARVVYLEKDLDALRTDKVSADEMLARRTREVTDLEKKRAAAGERIAALEGELKDRGADAAAAARRAADLAAKVKDAEARAREYRDKLTAEEALAKGLEKEVSKRTRGQEDAEKSLEGLRLAKGGLERDLDRARKDLDAARRSVVALEDEKKGLVAAAERERAAADNRFAGIQLTGRRVVFLVDMSGSMDYVDENTRAPEKWSGVRETLAKILRSLPELEKYQVVLFSDKVTFLIGDGQGWLDFDARSAGRVSVALEKVKPKGGTNMYGAFDAAFRFRGQGLDTIYLLSDGLPNMGEGLTEEQAKGLKETEQGEILGKYVRRKLRTDWNREIRGEGRVRVNAVGFFYESPDVGAFLWALTRENEGGFVGMSKP
ncbi:MAG TPA: VWA domain-containing protein [Gemmataceae bacterium]|nr:VWA domain-containing protein [Gemmataceae bacterium]